MPDDRPFRVAGGRWSANFGDAQLYFAPISQKRGRTHTNIEQPSQTLEDVRIAKGVLEMEVCRGPLSAVRERRRSIGKHLTPPRFARTADLAFAFFRYVRGARNVGSRE